MHSPAQTKSCRQQAGQHSTAQQDQQPTHSSGWSGRIECAMHAMEALADGVCQLLLAVLQPHHDALSLPAECQVSGQRQQHLSLCHIPGCKQAQACTRPCLSSSNIDLRSPRSAATSVNRQPSPDNDTIGSNAVLHSTACRSLWVAKQAVLCC